MTLAHGRHYLAIPGPSVVPDRVLQAMHRPAPNIYEGELIELTRSLVVDLKKVARTTADVAMYIANGHGAWEAALANTHSRGDRVLVLATGRFAIGWAEMATRLGIDCEIIDFGNRSNIDIARVEEVLAEDKAHAFKSVMAVHVDTSSSVRNDVAALRAALDRAGHPALLMIDCIASLACDRFEMDAWGADLMVAGCQKGLMTPPGLAFVYFNGRADAARDRADCVTAYWDWRPRANPRDYYQYFGGTAPTHHLYGQRAALDMIAAEGMEQIWARHERLARAIWAAFETWGQDGPMQLNIADPGLRSCAVTSVRIGAPHGTELRDWLTRTAGVTLGIGLGMADKEDPAWHGFFRVGHMGHVNAHMVLGVLGTIESGLVALGIPHGRGALDAAAGICSGV
ncbi:MAG: aminotransferase class V-fold PLP-dependent enzyme [Rhodobacteraceae bacterium]|nr:aminotransferase class V-fold PLP-dependent enzyme [Paracoccaceae bacterium]